MSLLLQPQVSDCRFSLAESGAAYRSDLSFWCSRDPRAAACTRELSLQTAALAKWREMTAELFRQIPASLFPRQRPVAPALRRRSLRRRESARILARPCEHRQGNGFHLRALRPDLLAPPPLGTQSSR